MRILILMILMTGSCFADSKHPDKFGHPYHSYESIKYESKWGSGEVNCDVTEYGRVYTCILGKPCAPKGDNPCGCSEDICQKEPK